MNELIKIIAVQGESMTYYGLVNDIALILAILYSLYHGKRYGINLWKMVIIIAFAYAGRIVLQNVIWEALLYIKSAHFLGIQTAVNSIVRIFIFMPLVVWPMAKLFKYKWGHVCDAIAMFLLITSAFAQIGCIFPGCCAGYEVGWGLYNPITGGYHFPVQIFETFLTLIIIAYLIYHTHKTKFVSDGTLYPIMMVLYGFMRYICELLRDNEKIVFGNSAMGIHALFMCVVGLVVLYEMKSKRAKAAVETSHDEINATEEAIVTENIGESADNAIDVETTAIEDEDNNIQSDISESTNVETTTI